MKKFILCITSVLIFSFFLMGCGKAEEERVKQAEIIKDKQKDEIVGDTIIRIYSQEKSLTVSKAVEAYEKTYPDIAIEYLTGDLEKNQDVLQEMIEGSGPDLIVADGTFQKEILKNNLLSDINDKVNLKDQISLFKEKFDSYFVPIRFSIPFLFTKAELPVSSINKILEASGQFRMNDVTYDEVIELLYLYYSSELLNENGTIEETKLTEFVENAVYIAKTQEIKEEAEGKDELQKIKDFLAGDSTVIGHNVMGMLDARNYIGAAVQGGKAWFVEESLKPEVQIGINKNSPYQEECLKFIEKALSYEMQKEDLSEGFPVNEQALDEWAETYAEDEEILVLGEVDGMQIDIHCPPEEDMKTMIELAKGMSNRYIRDMELLELIKTESRKYYDEKESLAQVIKNIMAEFAA